MKRSNFHLLLLISAFSVLSVVHSSSASDLKALIVDGQNNHGVWPKGTLMMRQYLLDSGIFAEVDVARTKYLSKGEEHAALLPLANSGVEGTFEKQPMTDPDFAPDFSKYDLVVSNFGHGAASWPAATMAAFEDYVTGGGGFVSVHAADNSFPLWTEYNKMIGLGGWGGRNENAGPYVYIDAEGKEVRDTSPGNGGKHGKEKAAFLITTRNTEHPITKGLPATWLHDVDECYSFLRGPAENLTILATASDREELQAAGRNEPMLMVLDYHKGRVFHTTLGHAEEALECVGFITTFQRGAQWAATGKVTQSLPADFPGPDAVSSRPFELPAAK